MRVTFKVYFYVLNDKRKTVEKPIFCRISSNGKRTTMSTQQTIEPKLWDKKSQRAKGRSEKSIRVNQALSKLETELVSTYNKIKERRKNVESDYLKDHVQGNVQSKENVTVLAYFDTYNERLNKRVEIKDLTKESRDRYVLVRDRFADFLKTEKGKNDMYLDEIDNDLAYDFYLYIRKTTDSQNNNAQKHVQKLHTVVKSAWISHYIPSDPLGKSSAR